MWCAECLAIRVRDSEGVAIAGACIAWLWDRLDRWMRRLWFLNELRRVSYDWRLLAQAVEPLLIQPSLD